MDLAGFKARGDRAAAYCEALAAVEQAALDEAAARDRALLQELLTAVRRAVRGGEGARVGARLRGPPARGARPAPLAAGAPRARAGALPLDPRGRVPGHEPPADGDRRPAARHPTTELFFVGDEFQSIYGFRHADVQVFRERRAPAGGRSRSRSTTARGRRCSPRSTSSSAPTSASEFQELAAAAEFPDPVFGHPVELLVTDKESYKDSGVHWRRGEARAVARRVRELVDAGAATPGEIVLLFAAGTDAEWYEDELRAAGLPTYRATGKGYFGQQQVVDLLMYLRLLQNRYDDEALVTVLASPFVGVSNDALALHPPGGAAAAAVHGDRARAAAGARRAGRAADARLPPALRPARGGDAAALARAALRADRRRARLRPRRARAVGRPAALREHAQARAARALVRGAARAGRRGLRPLRRRAGGGRRARARGGRRGGGRRRRPAAHDPRREGARVQGRDRRRRRPRPRGAVAGRDPRAARRPLRLPRRRSRDGEAARRLRLRGGEGGAAAGGARRAPAPLLRRDDAREGAPDRLRLGRLRLGARDATTPIAWVLDRLEAEEELAAAGEAPVELVRGDARLLVRVDRFRASPRPRPPPEDAGGGGPAAAVRRARGGRGPAAGSRAAAARRAAGAAAPPRPPALVHGARRRSSSARTSSARATGSA